MRLASISTESGMESSSWLLSWSSCSRWMVLWLSRPVLRSYWYSKDNAANGLLRQKWFSASLFGHFTLGQTEAGARMPMCAEVI